MLAFAIISVLVLGFLGVVTYIFYLAPGRESRLD
jgi:hypothetical protein